VQLGGIGPGSAYGRVWKPDFWSPPTAASSPIITWWNRGGKTKTSPSLLKAGSGSGAESGRDEQLTSPESPTALRWLRRRFPLTPILAVVGGDVFRTSTSRRWRWMTVPKAAVSGQPGRADRLSDRASDAIPGAHQRGCRAVDCRQHLRRFPTGLMKELAHRNLIRPVNTQGHIGDVLSDKIVYDGADHERGIGRSAVQWRKAKSSQST